MGELLSDLDFDATVRLLRSNGFGHAANAFEVERLARKQNDMLIAQAQTHTLNMVEHKLRSMIQPVAGVGPGAPIGRDSYERRKIVEEIIAVLPTIWERK